jgi:hypothetical protein
MTTRSKTNALVVVACLASIVLASFAGCLSVAPTKPHGCRAGDIGCADSTVTVTATPSSSGGGGSGGGG